jgi:hypothetical protein
LTEIERHDISRTLWLVLAECCAIVLDMGEENAAAAVARKIRASGKKMMTNREIADCAYRLAAQLRYSNHPHAPVVRRIVLQLASTNCWQENLSATPDRSPFLAGPRLK